MAQLLKTELWAVKNGINNIRIVVLANIVIETETNQHQAVASGR